MKEFIKYIDFYIKNKIITVDKSTLPIDGVIGDNIGYISRFHFDEEWNSKIKTARFYKNNYNASELKEEVILENDECEIPIEILKGGILEVGIFAEGKATTKCGFRIKCSILESDGVPSDPSPDLYNQIMEKLESLIVPDIAPEKIAQAIEDYLNEHPISDTDVFSPVVSISEITGGHSVSVTSATGTQSFDVLDGQNAPDILAGKNIVCFGDSLMAGNIENPTGDDGLAGAIKRKHPDTNIYNFAKNGSVLCSKSRDFFATRPEHRECIAEKVFSFISNPTVNPDYIIIDGIANDFSAIPYGGLGIEAGSEAVLGTVPPINDVSYTDYTTVYNAIDYMLIHLIEKFPDAKIMFIGFYHNNTNIKNYYAELDKEMEIANNISSVCAKYGVIFCDLGRSTVGVTWLTRPYTSPGSFFSDGVGHMTIKGYDFISDIINNCLVTGISNNQYDGINRAANGVDGKSAYELAVENGFEGTLTEWLYSLNGSNGTNGTNGQNGEDGIDGITFTPSISSSGVISWTNDGDKQNPSSIDLVQAVINALPKFEGGVE